MADPELRTRLAYSAQLMPPLGGESATPPVSPPHRARGPTLSALDVSSFRREGYLIVDGLLDGRELSALKATVADFKARGLLFDQSRTSKAITWSFLLLLLSLSALN